MSVAQSASAWQQVTQGIEHFKFPELMPSWNYNANGFCFHVLIIPKNHWLTLLLGVLLLLENLLLLHCPKFVRRR